ncbi:protein arginine methyltransferase NDUFAF7, mitochondrial-like [Oncorhynchus keta]|uniref:protein arginine methyltransferase NDUFAF7, mitochondrial-like n=1 Tax=Oncorhynchus keta TaxID=8018 RepID=UPI0015FE77B6|nr:protein arginine methyltransferase NDUFAF7, mitochondrial-like [Oncorhynchus keta]
MVPFGMRIIPPRQAPPFGSLLPRGLEPVLLSGDDLEVKPCMIDDVCSQASVCWPGLHTDEAGEVRRLVEVCPEGGDIVQQLANRIAEDGGAALIVDYGHGGTKTDTFRGFKDPKLHDVLASPGSADLTADVDFSCLIKMARATVVCVGPVCQRDFLKNMGIDTSLQVLLRKCADPSIKAELIQGYDMLTNPQKMGERFQFFTMLNHSRLTRPEQSEGGEKMAPVPK